MTMRTQSVLAAGATCLLLVAAGCGSAPGDTPPLATVSGTVTLDGQPLPEAMVSFIPEQGRASSAVTDAEGNYTLQYTAETPGAKIGKHSVTILTNPQAAGAERTASNHSERVPARYNAQTTLTAEVKEGGNKIDFPLESK